MSDATKGTTLERFRIARESMKPELRAVFDQAYIDIHAAVTKHGEIGKVALSILMLEVSEKMAERKAGEQS